MTRRDVAMLLGVFCFAGCSRPDTTATVSTGQALIELSDAVNDVRQETAVLQEQIDSLRLVVARQDSLVTRLALTAGVPLPPR